MNWKNTSHQTRLYISSAIILFTGLTSSLLIYLTAENVSNSVLGYEVEDSKKYMHDIELYGGKANVLATELMNWLNGLWHGKSLAYTVACITLIISAGIFFFAYYSPTDLNSDERDENKLSGTD